MINLNCFKLKNRDISNFITVNDGTGYQFGSHLISSIIVSSKVNLPNGNYLLDHLKHGVTTIFETDLPPLPTLGKSIQSAIIPVSDLKQAASFVSKDKLRLTFNYVFLDKSKIVDTDAHKLIQIPIIGSFTGFIIPLVIKLLPNKGDAHVSKYIDSDTSWISITMRNSAYNATILFTEPVVNFPNYKAAIPPEFTLLGSISFTKPSKSDLNKIAYFSSNSNITQDGIYGSDNGKEEVFIALQTRITGNYTSVKVVTKDLIQCLDAVAGDNVSIKFFGLHRPAIINDSILLMTLN